MGNSRINKSPYSFSSPPFPHLFLMCSSSPFMKNTNPHLQCGFLLKCQELKMPMRSFYFDSLKASCPQLNFLHMSIPKKPPHPNRCVLSAAITMFSISWAINASVVLNQDFPSFPVSIQLLRLIDFSFKLFLIHIILYIYTAIFKVQHLNTIFPGSF